MVSFALLAAFLATSQFYRADSRYRIATFQERRSKYTNFEKPIVLDSISFIDLPLFPLRKSVRVPSDSITLNLYEQRYIKMSEHILQENSNLFGTIYASSKAQIVKGGLGAIVPLLEVGDIGVLCVVQKWSDDMVPTSDPTYKRRRIKLNAVAVTRFRIEEIIDDGIMGPSFPSFIRAKVSLLQDRPLSDDAGKNTLKRLEDKVLNAVSAKERRKRVKDSTGALVDQVVALASVDGLSEKDQRREAFSFAAARVMGPEVPSPQRIQQLLQIIDTEERLKLILE